MEKTRLKAAAWFLGAVTILPLLNVPCASQKLGAHPKKTAPSASIPKVGDIAPDFKMQYFDGHDLKDVSLADYRGKKNVVLAFYIFAFTGG